MFTPEKYSSMEAEALATPHQYAKQVLYLPRADRQWPLQFIHDSEAITLMSHDVYCGPGRPSRWPSINCDKDFPANDFTRIGYQNGSLSCLARVIAAKIIGCRIEWLNQFICFPDNTNYLDLREENIYFQTRGEYTLDTYKEWSISDLREYYREGWWE